MTHLVFDLGNSRLKFAQLREDGTIDQATAIAHDSHRLPDAWSSALPMRFEAATIACVASESLRSQLLDTLVARCTRISFAEPQPGFEALRIAYPQPQTLGVDRFLAMLGARARGRQAWLVVGIGTAITLDLIDSDSRHRGGRIAASPTLMRDALHARSARLPQTGGHTVAFADNTLDALRTGCDEAALALVVRTREIGTELLGAQPALIMHGGGVDALSTWPDDAIHAPQLVLEGLAVWARADSSAHTMSL